MLFELKGKNLDPALVSVLARLAEAHHVNSKAIAEAVILIDKMTDIIQGMTTVAENLKAEAERLKPRDDADPTLSSFPNQERSLEAGNRGRPTPSSV